MKTLITILIFVACPTMAIIGFTMYRYPKAWIPANKKSDSKLLARIRRLGPIFVVLAGFELLSMLYLKAISSSHHLPF